MVAHRAWVNTLREYLHDTSPNPPELDSQRCHFGRWLNSHDDDIHPSLHPLHEQVHQLGRELVVLKQQGNTEQAQVRFVEMEVLRDQLIEAMLGLVGSTEVSE
jgi:hypothetical protein